VAGAPRGLSIKQAIGIVVFGCAVGGLVLAMVLAVAWAGVDRRATDLSSDSAAILDLRRLDDELAAWATKVDLVLGGGQTWFLPDLKQSAARMHALLERMGWDALRTVKGDMATYIDTELDRLHDAAVLYGEDRPDQLGRLVDASDAELVSLIEAFRTADADIRRVLQTQRLGLQRARSSLQVVSWTATALYLLGMALLWRWASTTITKPIRLLAMATEQALATAMPLQVRPSGPAEIRGLTESVTSLTGRLEEIVVSRTRAIERSSELRRVILDTVPLPLAHIDARGLVETCNRACEAFFGVEDRARVIGELADELPIGRLLAHGEGQCEVMDAAGRTRTVHVTTAAVPDRGGTILCLFDVTEQVADAAKLRAMLRELDHRVRNTLAAIQSLVDMELVDADASKEGLLVLSGRIQAMAKAHELLAVTQRTGVDLGHALEVIIRPWSAEGAFALEGPEIRVRPETALPLCLMMNELATNAVKHGALSDPGGRVRVNWSHTGDVIDLIWTESGGPVAGPPDNGHGTGLGLIRGFVEHQLQGTCQLNWADEGLIASLSFKR